jgi:hypothetical protein
MKAIFNNFFFMFKGFWKISSDIFKNMVEQRYIKDKKYAVGIHHEISLTLDKTMNSIRKLEEKTNHLFQAEDWVGLKHTLSSIETFLLLFNPFTKYDLCRYWQVLGGKGFDPVDQYNNGLEQFDMHYSPKEEELFTIILQISRFLKEFTDFETKGTPVFRHPFIRGKVTQYRATNPLKGDHDDCDPPTTQAGLPGKNKILAHIESKVEKQRGKNGAKKLPFQDDDVEVSDCDDECSTELKDSNKLNYLTDIGLLNELKKMSMTELTSKAVLEGHEKFNVDVPSGKSKFLDHFHDLINEKKVKKGLNDDKIDNESPDFEIEQKSEGEDNFGKDGMREMLKVKTDAPRDKDQMQRRIEEIDLTIEPTRKPSFYYYKRWLWMMFPWVCMSVNKLQTFSELINKCYSSNIRY